MASILLKSTICDDAKPSSSHAQGPAVGTIETAFSLSQKDCSKSEREKIYALLHDSPERKAPNPSMENYHCYPLALEVYQAVSIGKPLSKLRVQTDNSAVKRKVYQLVFDSLYHYEILEEVLVESSFYAKYFHMNAEKSLLHIMLFDFQSSKFTLKLPDNDDKNVSKLVASIARALWDHKIKLNATLARMRVKGNALVIYQLIPDPVSRELYEANCIQPCYLRVNTIKVQDVRNEVLNQLCNEGFLLVDSETELYRQKNSIWLLDEDMLVFSSDCRGLLDTHSLVENGYLIPQNIRSYEFVNRIRANIERCSGDVIITEPSSGLEIAHIATILGHRGTVLVYNTRPIDIHFIEKKLNNFEVKNVEFMDESFICACSEDEFLANVQIIILPSAIPSVVDHCVDYAVQEGDQIPSVLLPPGKKDEMSSSTDEPPFSNYLTNVFTFKQVVCIIYDTCSNYKTDNESLIRKALDEYNSNLEGDGKKYDLISSLISAESEDSSDNDCFTAIIEREPDKDKMTLALPPRDVIERAIAKGLIDGEGISDTKLIKKRKSKLKRNLKPLTHRHSFPVMTIAAQQKVVQKKEVPKTTQKVFKP